MLNGSAKGRSRRRRPLRPIVATLQPLPRHRARAAMRSQHFAAPDRIFRIWLHIFPIWLPGLELELGKSKCANGHWTRSCRGPIHGEVSTDFWLTGHPRLFQRSNEIRKLSQTSRLPRGKDNAARDHAAQRCSFCCHGRLRPRRRCSAT
jgi:hypothetical protein